MTSQPITVLVTGVSGGGVGYGLLETASRLRPRVRTIGTDINRNSAGLLKADKGFVVPPANDPRYVDAIVRLCHREHVRAVIPGSEPELFVLTRAKAQLERAGLLLLANDHALVAACKDKSSMHDLFRAHGVPSPDSALPANVKAFVRKHGYPFLLKPRSGSGSRNLSIATNARTYAEQAKRLDDMGIPFLLQAYVGTGAQEYTVGVVTRRDGSVVGSITVHRLLSGLSSQHDVVTRAGRIQTSTGITQGQVQDNRLIQRQCEAYAVKLGVRGPANFQGRLIGKRFVVFELNPRFSGTTPFRALAGFNDIGLVLNDHLGRAVTRPRFQSGLVILRTLENIPTTLAHLRRIPKA